MKVSHRVIGAMIGIAAAGSNASAQHPVPSSPVAFADVSVKQSEPASVGRGIRFSRGGVLAATGVTLRELIAYAYQRHPFDRREVIGGPLWIDSVRFDITATAAEEHRIDPDGAPRATYAMLRALLAERFQLRVEEENRQTPVHVLLPVTTVDQLGPRIQRTSVDCGAVMGGEAATPAGAKGPPCTMKTPPGRLFANTVTMATLASLLSRHVDRPVVDGTGLQGRFDVEIEAADIKPPPNYRPGPSDLTLPPAAGPSLFVAVREQLGLTLRPQLAAIPVLVVRGAERPAPD